MIFSFINARILFKKEGRSLRNSLTLAVGIGILGLFILSFFQIQDHLPEQLGFLFTFSYFCIYYISFFFIEFFVSSMLYQVYFPKHDKDFIIVLGSGPKSFFQVDKDPMRRLMKRRLWQTLPSEKVCHRQIAS